MKTTMSTRWMGVEPPTIFFNILRQSSPWAWPIWRWLRSGMALVGLSALFAHIGPLLRLADTTAAVVDVGALSLVLLAVVALAAFLTVSRWLLGLLWPVMRNYQRNHFANNFKSLLPWQKITFYLVIFFGLLYAFVCCLVAVF